MYENQITLPRSGAEGLVVFDTIKLGGLPFANLDRKDTAALLLKLATSKRRSLPWIATSGNGHVISACYSNPAELARLLKADLLSCDGQPIVTISRMLSDRGLAERVATTDLIHDICEQAGEVDFTVYLLGSTPAENEAARKGLEAQYPALRIVGNTHGYHSEQEWPQVVHEINTIGPDLLIVSMGVPLEHQFYDRYAAQLPDVGVIKTAGGLLNFLAGSQSRAPKWMQDAGFEWLFRLAMEPKRLIWRYLVTNPHSLYLLLSRKPVHDSVVLDVQD